MVNRQATGQYLFLTLFCRDQVTTTNSTDTCPGCRSCLYSMKEFLPKYLVLTTTITIIIIVNRLLAVLHMLLQAAIQQFK